MDSALDLECPRLQFHASFLEQKGERFPQSGEQKLAEHVELIRMCYHSCPKCAGHELGLFFASAKGHDAELVCTPCIPFQPLGSVHSASLPYDRLNLGSPIRTLLETLSRLEQIVQILQDLRLLGRFLPQVRVYVFILHTRALSFFCGFFCRILVNPRHQKSRDL